MKKKDDDVKRLIESAVPGNDDKLIKELTQGLKFLEKTGNAKLAKKFKKALEEIKGERENE
jgi:hypothetical protein